MQLNNPLILLYIYIHIILKPLHSISNRKYQKKIKFFPIFLPLYNFINFHNYTFTTRLNTLVSFPPSRDLIFKIKNHHDKNHFNHSMLPWWSARQKEWRKLYIIERSRLLWSRFERGCSRVKFRHILSSPIRLTFFLPFLSLFLSLSSPHIYFTQFRGQFEFRRLTTLLGFMDDIGSCFLTFFGSFVFACDTVTISDTVVIRIVYVCYGSW